MASRVSHFGERVELLGTLLDHCSLPRLRSCETESNAQAQREIPEEVPLVQALRERIQREIPEEVPDDEVPEVCAATLDATVPWRRYKKTGPSISQDVQGEIPEAVPDDEVPEVCAAALDDRLQRFKQISPSVSQDVHLMSVASKLLDHADAMIPDAIEAHHANHMKGLPNHADVTNSLNRHVTLIESDKKVALSSACQKFTQNCSLVAAVRGGDPSATARFVLGRHQFGEKMVDFAKTSPSSEGNVQMPRPVFNRPASTSSATSARSLSNKRKMREESSDTFCAIDKSGGSSPGMKGSRKRANIAPMCLDRENHVGE